MRDSCVVLPSLALMMKSSMFWPIIDEFVNERQSLPRHLEITLADFKGGALGQPESIGGASCSSTICHTELSIDVRQVKLDGLLRHKQLCSVCTIGKTPRDSSQNSQLAFREARGLRIPPRVVV